VADDRYPNDRVLSAGMELAEQTARADTEAADPLTRVRAWSIIKALERSRELDAAEDLADTVRMACEDTAEALRRADPSSGVPEALVAEREALRRFFEQISRANDIFVRTQMPAMTTEIKIERGWPGGSEDARGE
jgi:hypothetical protein